MSYSEKFLEIMGSVIRPKCEPKITVMGTDGNGEVHTVIWNAKDIKSLNFHRSIDPVGRSLPIMELQWTEVYYGKFNEQNFPLKYNNIVKYMSVSLEFNQYLGFYQTWKSLKALTWKQVKDMTWKQLKNEVAYETVKTPMMFLSANPEISGHTIKWTAKDALSFLTEKQIKDFGVDLSLGGNPQIPFYNPIIYLLINARATFNRSKELFEYYTRTINYFNDLDKTKLLKNGIIFDGATNSEIMNYLSPLNEYLDFDEDKIVKKEFVGARMVIPQKTIPLNLQYGTPACEPCTPMSTYLYNRYRITTNGQIEEISPSNVLQIGTSSGKSIYKLEYYFKGYGQALGSDDLAAPLYDISHAIRISEDKSISCSYIPIEYNPIPYSIELGQSENCGECYTEDNHLNIYSITENALRGYNLSNWFSSENHVIKNRTPALFNWGIGEYANVETLLWDDSTNKNYIAPSMLLECHIEYNGVIKQNNIAHEVRSLG